MEKVISFKDFKIGQNLRVKGVQGENGEFAAQKIVIKDAPAEAVIIASIQKIHANTLRVLNHDITIPNELEQNLTEMQPGQIVELKGKYYSEQGFAPEKIEPQDSAYPVEELQGGIDAIDHANNTLQVLGVTVEVDELNTVISVDSALVYSQAYSAYFEAVGERQYLASARLKDSWGGPFNGQSRRQELFAELVEKISFAAIIETGTFRGTTTAFMHETTQLPVHTVELHPQYYGYARARFRGNDQVRVCSGDSRVFLKQLAQDPELAGKQVFCYLDAHWAADLPLLEEVQITFDNWSRAVLMIDDFKVPADAGYGYDDYGPGKALNLEYLRPLSELSFTAFFPSKSSEVETGRKRGCVVLARDADLILKLKEMKSLAGL